jgi:nucleoside 2-deoxyribosyltransferase
MRVYLAGPIFQCEDNECVDWRQEVASGLPDCDILDPMERDYRGVTNENYQKIVEEDKADIDTCDVLLVNHIKPSVGTSMEILYAWERKKHIVIVSNNGDVSPWLLYHSDKIIASFDEALEYISNLPS